MTQMHPSSTSNVLNPRVFNAKTSGWYASVDRVQEAWARVIYSELEDRCGDAFLGLLGIIAHN